MNAIRLFLLFSLCIQLISCGKSEKQLAAEKLQQAEFLLQQRDTTGALQTADSVLTLYKGAIQQVVNAKQFKKKVYSELLFAAQDEFDTLKALVIELEKIV